MIIKGIKYSRYPDMPREWRVVGKDDNQNEDYAYFGNLNLLVGKNAAGKSRVLRAIHELANLISGRQLIKNTHYSAQKFDILFENEGKEYRYLLYFSDNKIIEEFLYIDELEVLNRGGGFILTHNKKIDVSSDVEKDTLLVSTKCSNGEYYFYDLFLWALSLRTFTFSDQFEKNKYIEDIHSLNEKDLASDNLGIIIPIFDWSREQFGQAFEDEILECMNLLGYSLTDIAIKKLSRGYSICVEEEGKYIVSQQEMSQGMFRALALFVLLVNARWRKMSICILVDDIGEGLDYERSKTLIDLVVQKVYNTNIQYFMSSNDRYIMNQINLRYWTVIDRVGSKSIFYNIFNSKDNYESFKYTGLNNFDFFTTNFYRDGFGDDDSPEEEN